MPITLALLDGLVSFWAMRGLLHEGRYWLERALPVAGLERLSGTLDPEARLRLARVTLRAADVYFLQGAYLAVFPYVEASLALWRALEQPGPCAIALLILAGAASLVGDHARAEALREEAAWLTTSADDASARAFLALSQGRITRQRGQPREARSWLTQAVAHYREQGDLWLLSAALLDLAPVLLVLGEAEAAEAHAAEALDVARRLGSRTGVATTLNDLGEIARYGGRDAEAEVRYRASQELFQRAGSEGDLPRLHHNLAHLALRRGELTQAAEGFLASLAAFAAQRTTRGVMEALIGLGAVATAAGMLLEAARLWGAAASLAAGEGYDLWPPDQLAYAAALARARGESDGAAFQAAWQEGATLRTDEAVTAGKTLARRIIAT